MSRSNNSIPGSSTPTDGKTANTPAPTTPSATASPSTSDSTPSHTPPARTGRMRSTGFNPSILRPGAGRPAAVDPSPSQPRSFHAPMGGAGPASLPSALLSAGGHVQHSSPSRDHVSGSGATAAFRQMGAPQPPNSPALSNGLSTAPSTPATTPVSTPSSRPIQVPTASLPVPLPPGTQPPAAVCSTSSFHPQNAAYGAAAATAPVGGFALSYADSGERGAGTYNPILALMPQHSASGQLPDGSVMCGKPYEVVQKERSIRMRRGRVPLDGFDRDRLGVRPAPRNHGAGRVDSPNRHHAPIRGDRVGGSGVNEQEDVGAGVRLPIPGVHRRSAADSAQDWGRSEARDLVPAALPDSGVEGNGVQGDEGGAGFLQDNMMPVSLFTDAGTLPDGSLPGGSSPASHHRDVDRAHRPSFVGDDVNGNSFPARGYADARMERRIEEPDRRADGGDNLDWPGAGESSEEEGDDGEYGQGLSAYDDDDDSDDDSSGALVYSTRNYR